MSIYEDVPLGEFPPIGPLDTPGSTVQAGNADTTPTPDAPRQTVADVSVPQEQPAAVDPMPVTAEGPSALSFREVYAGLGAIVGASTLVDEVIGKTDTFTGVVIVPLGVIAVGGLGYAILQTIRGRWSDQTPNQANDTNVAD